MASGILDGVSILVAEDNEPSLELVLVLLRVAGASVTGVPDGAAAVDRLGAQKFDAVLMDVQMPVLDGYEATREIRRRESRSGDHVVVIGVTAHAMPEHIESCLAAGMNTVITKPIDPGTFAQTVKEHLGDAIGRT